MSTFYQRVSSFLFFALTLILPNLFFVIASLCFALGRPWVNLDYIFFSILFSLNLRIAAFLFLLLAVAVDAFNLIGQVYPFIRVNDLLYLSRFVLFSSGKSQVYIGLSIASLLFLFLFFLRVSKKIVLLHSLVLFNIAVGFYLFEVYGEGGERDRYWRVTDRPFVSSQVVNFHNYRSRGFVEAFTLTGEPFTEIGFRGATARWEKDLNNLPDKVLLVVNESWGVSANEEIHAAVMGPIIKKGSRYEVQVLNDMSFIGATVAAEFRELCGLRPNHFNIAPVIFGFDNCLPKRLSQRGYSTYALHGAVGTMYDRHLWYPRVGFQHATFFENRTWPKRCHSFPGACDEDVAKEVKRSLEGGGKKFVYWLTLNSHNFYDARDIKIDVFSCEELGVRQGTETCRNLKLQAQFFYVLSRILDDPELSGLEVIVVGDHAPPIFNSDEKEEYFKDGSISILSFRVK